MTECPPIVIMGANHTGTRVFVEILEALGSDPGHIDNQWREEESFLALHKDLLSRISDRTWRDTRLDLQFVESFTDDGRFLGFMRTWLADHLDQSFPNRQTRPWHWKCPTAVMFLPSWLQIFPDAYYVHVERDPLDVARSLVRRREFIRFSDAERFYHLMNQRILREAPGIKRYVRLAYEGLPGNLDQLIGALELNPSQAQIDAAARLVRPPRTRVWRKERSVLGNLWEHVTTVRARLRAGRR